MSLPEPVTRKEQYLAKAATGSGSIPSTPVTREEMYLAEIANGGGGGGRDMMVVHVSDIDGVKTMDKTYAEIETHMRNGGVAIIHETLKAFGINDYPPATIRPSYGTLRAQDAYNKGDKVHYPDEYSSIYVSTIDYNTWAPNVYGWEEVTT